jgi:hypothetical protein
MTTKLEQFKDKPIIITFPPEYRNKCPLCSHTEPYVNKFKERDYHYNEYIERCIERHGENAWPVCFSCWPDWDMCHGCGTPLLDGIIYNKSTDTVEAPKRDHVCTYCCHLNDEQIEQKQKEDEKKAIEYEKKHKENKKGISLKKTINKKK